MAQTIDLVGEPAGTRTQDHLIKSQVLYQLSYGLAAADVEACAGPVNSKHRLGALIVPNTPTRGAPPALAPSLCPYARRAQHTGCARHTGRRGWGDGKPYGFTPAVHRPCRRPTQAQFARRPSARFRALTPAGTRALLAHERAAPWGADAAAFPNRGPRLRRTAAVRRVSRHWSREMPIVNRVADLHSEITAWRRDIHAHPQLLYDVHRTAASVAEKLKAFGCDEVVAGIGRTGVVGVIKGNRPGGTRKTIGLRADMDALPIQEASELPYKSTVAGKMHACGHDGHTAMLLGAAKY